MKRLYIILALVFVAVSVAGFVFWRYFYLSTVTIDPVPTEALITVNGKPTANRTFYLPRGTHTIEVTAPGYRRERISTTTDFGTHVTKRVELIALPRPEKLLDGPITSLTPSPDRKSLFFERNDVLYRFDVGIGDVPALPITPQLEDVAEVSWSSPDFQLALLRKSNGDVWLYDFNRYDLLHQSFRSLGTNVKNFIWDTDGFYFENLATDGEHSIVKANRAGSGLTRLVGLVGFPLSKFVFSEGPENHIFISSNNPKEPADIYLFNTYEKLTATLTDSGAGYGPVISPKKSRFAYTDNGELVVADADGKNRRNTGLRPRPGNYSFIDETRLAVLTPDQIAVFDITSGKTITHEVFAPSDAVTSFIARPDGKAVYYVFQGKLYQLIFDAK